MRGMVRFEVEMSSTSTGIFHKMRLGRLLEWSRAKMDQTENIRTPSYLLYTRSGHIPHLTWKLADKHLRFEQKPILQLTLSSIFDQLESAKNYKGGTDSLTHLSIWDPLGERPFGFNANSYCSIWINGGRKNLTHIVMRNSINAVKPNSYSTLFDYDTSRDSLNKRLTKSTKRSIEWIDSLCLSKYDGEFDETECTPFISLGGGFSAYHRQKVAKELCSRSYAKAFNMDLSGFSANSSNKSGSETEDSPKFDEAEIKSLISDALAELPADKARLVEGVFDPSQIFFLVQMGFDIFDSSYTCWLADQGKAFCVADDYPSSSSTFTVLDFNDKKYQRDFSKPFAECTCYCCKNYSKAYLQHLQNTKEMLSQILLTIHNLHEFDRMFARIRRFLATELGEPNSCCKN
ncbi:queuine tRNA-ribosyltransferase domain-containing protein [Ditylenchus destructor]|uniref:Queuine tRNA-ribosyltransferase accessory subunit 2 n=1 Tax=Ditylenchus destructor TaxID=166010 RepID=A0AAD4MSD6_9BILA|nr:queuine tRNA-ribosyltransferase domain-containing protein [Ditylenchus destructor]